MSIPKLSEAILLSIGVVGERRDFYLIDDNDRPYGCAIGTALYSVGLRYGDLSSLYQFWPWTRGACLAGQETSVYSQRYPRIPPEQWTIAHEISHRHVVGASREAIAAWIATIEPQEEGAKEPLDKDAKDIQRELEESLNGNEDNSEHDAVKMGQCGHDE